MRVNPRFLVFAVGPHGNRLTQQPHPPRDITQPQADLCPAVRIVADRIQLFPVTASFPSRKHRLTTRFIKCTTAISSAANNSTLAKRAIVGLLNPCDQPTDTKHDGKITAIP